MDTDIISIANFREQSFENNNMKKTSKNIVKIKNGSKNLNSTKENSEMKINFIGYADKKIMSILKKIWIFLVQFRKISEKLSKI